MLASDYDLRQYGKIGMVAGVILLSLGMILQRARHDARKEAREAVNWHELNHHPEEPEDGA